MTLEDILRYENAAVAVRNIKNDAPLAVLAMEEHYKKILGKDYDEDPCIQQDIHEAKAGLDDEAGITNLSLVNAMKVYSNKYTNALNSTKLSELSKYLTEGFKVPEEAAKSFEKYKDFSLLELSSKQKDKEIKAEDKEEIAKMSQAVMLLLERRLKGKGFGIYNNVAKFELEQLYAKKEDKEDKK